jgi:putative ABC transport system permease protein
MAESWWPNESPIGRHIRVDTPDAQGPWLTVVGVAGDVAQNVWDRQPRRVVYVPIEQDPQLWMDIGVRTSGDPLLLAPAVSAAIRGVDAEQPITEMHTLERQIHDRAIGMNYVAVLMAVFGGVALLLSAVGVYGVMAYLVSEQTRDIGVRMALGAQQGNVLAMVFRRGMLVAGAGLVIGLTLAFGVAHLIASLVYGVSATDPATFVGIPLALLAATALAIYIPARRATKIDPIVALRYE